MSHNTPQKNTASLRPPVVVVMGHIDHGKSTLLDFIRSTNIVAKEAGGITQHVSAYEVEHTIGEGKDGAGTVRNITFLDTPGHEAFRSLRERGAGVADIAILVVSAEDGVKPQTLEALEAIKTAGIPYIVAINKIDRPGANIERTQQSLAENEIYVEGYGGTTPAVPISAKTGTGIPELLDMILLVADLGEFTANLAAPAEGVVVESNRDPKKGLTATLIIKNGTLEKGMFVAAGDSWAPVRIMENFAGKPLQTATFSSPVKIIGWDTMVKAGVPFVSFHKKDEALAYVAAQKTAHADAARAKQKSASSLQSAQGVAGMAGMPGEEKATFPLIIKADTAGSVEAIVYEIGKMNQERITVHILDVGVGAIGEGDVKLASSDKKAAIVGFNVKIDTPAKNLADRDAVTIETFDIIYKLTDWIAAELVKRTPKMQVEEETGLSKILKVFSKTKDRQIIGGRVETGFLVVGEQVKIIRRENEVGSGRVRNLQQQKNETKEVKEGSEFGAMVESKIEIAPGDRLRSFRVVEK